jgi:5-methylcytosine-specific restriction endonuclease McrA
MQVRLCPRCGRRKNNAKTGLCPECQVADDRRRNTKRRESGRTTARWQRLRLAALHRDGYACQRCGQSGTRHTLTVHLDPALKGNHWIAALDDLTTLCRSCHGSMDAPRAHARR